MQCAYVGRWHVLSLSTVARPYYFTEGRVHREVLDHSLLGLGCNLYSAASMEAMQQQAHVEQEGLQEENVGGALSVNVLQVGCPDLDLILQR